ncbi:MAG: BatD family protein [Saprospiraceae bacterium]
MRAKFYIFFFFLPGILASQVRFETSIDAESVLQGSTFQISFELKNAQGTNFRPPDFSPFQIVSGPSRSMQTSIINGAMRSSVGFVYVLTCNQVGTFLIKEASIQVQGKTLYTKPVSIKIVKAMQSSKASADVIIQASLDKTEVFLGEQLTLSYKLYTRVNIENIELGSKPSLDAFQDQAVNMLNNPVRREIFNGREYTTKILSKTVLYPIKTGTYILDPTVYRIVKGEDDPFGFGMPSLFNAQVENIVTNELRIKIKELPVPVPDNFSGAVGDMSFQATGLLAEYSMNDAIHLKIQIHGNGNFNTIKSNFIQKDSSFEISDTKSGDIIKVTDEPAMTNTRMYNFLLVPKKPGAFILCPGFCYFNPALKKFVQQTDSFKINIVEGTKNTTAIGIEEDIHGFVDQVKLEYEPTQLFFQIKTWLVALFPICILLLGYLKKYSENLRIHRNAKKISPGMQLDKSLTLEYLEFLVIQKMRQVSDGKFEGNDLNTAKQFLNAEMNSMEDGSSILKIVNQLEIIKYSGAYSADLLLQLKTDIETI